MFWKIVERSTSILFLLIAISILTSQVNTQKSSAEILAEKKVIMDVLDNRTYYLEDKINRTTSSVDSYQVNMSSRVNVLEERMKSLEFRKRDNTRIVNNNSAVANGQPQ